MFILSPMRKTVKICRRSFYLRYRAPLLHECLDFEAPDFRTLRPWLLVLLVIPIVCYLFSDHSHTYPNVTHIKEDQKIVDKSTGIGHTEQTTTFAPVTSKHTVPESLPFCVLNKSKLGSSTLIIGRKGEFFNSTWVQAMLNKQYLFVKTGGYHSPPSCESRHKVGILVPYRDRPTHLAVFLYNMHPFLMKQKLEYRIFVIEQAGLYSKISNEPFNLGRLYNAGFKEMQKYGKWKCVVFHDVDLLPLDERILYTCPSYPRHMCSTVVEETDPKIRISFGGVASMTLNQFKSANGYSNMYWGWGGEDNDMFWRIRASGFPVVRYNKSIARYTALPHSATRRNHKRFQLLNTAMERWKEEGLSTVEYKVVSVEMRPLCTHIVVDVNPYKDNITVLMTNVNSYGK